MTDHSHINFTDSPADAATSGIQKAVALKHEKGAEDVPRVIASGRGHVAEQIMKIAFDRGIKVREDAELVDILELLEVDSPIPLEAFAAVAEILAHVYQANANAKRSNH